MAVDKKRKIQSLDLQALQCLERSAETIKEHGAGKPVTSAENQQRKVSWRPHVVCWVSAQQICTPISFRIVDGVCFPAH